jgi:tetratricopeptide (TPR) repeat protein
MNISRIRGMAHSGNMSVESLRYLIECHGECEHLDFKTMIHLDNPYGCACFSRDVLGMKNVGGGYIIIGVKDKTWEPIGLDALFAQDTKMLRDQVRKCTGMDIEVDIVHHEIYLDGKQRLFAMILVRSAIKRSKLRVPVVCAKDFHSNEKWGLRRGDIYVRHSDQTKRISSNTELQELLDDLETRYQEDSLEHANTLPSPFAVESGLYRILPREYETFVGRNAYKVSLRQAIERDPRIWIVNLYGPGGVGKSALATWLAYEYYHERRFESILHLSAKSLELSAGEGIRRLIPTLFSLEDFLDRVLHLFEHGEYCNKGLKECREIATEILSSFSTLLILDNMETIKDGRIMEFVRSLPVDTEAKVLLTSRRRTSEWEYPLQVPEFGIDEVKKFVQVRSKELGLDFPFDDADAVQQIAKISGGLPLAIQWIFGEYSRTRDLERILRRSIQSDSPLLEFSFRNSWEVLDRDAQQALAVLSIFDEHPTARLWRTALNWSVDKLDGAIADLVEVTFVTERTDSKTGNVTYSALPLTLTFARNELVKMKDLERQARLRYQEHRNMMELAAVETTQYRGLFEQFGAASETQKRSIILCRVAEGQARSLGYKAANEYYKKALDIAPRSIYALVSYALFKLELGNIGEAHELMQMAANYSTRQTGYYVHFNWAKIYDQCHDRHGRIRCLRKALEYEPDHTIAQHSLGVALSQNGQYDEALEIFEKIIQDELLKPGGPSESLAYALKTKIITLGHAGKNLSARRAHQRALEMVNKYENLQHLAHQFEDFDIE